MNKIKKFFATPKKSIISVAVIVCTLSVVGTGTAFAAHAVVEGKSIGKEKAQALAFADAGVDPAEVRKSRTELERKNGKFMYEVEFTADSTEYEYTISAKDGAVIEKDTDISRKAKKDKDKKSPEKGEKADTPAPKNESAPSKSENTPSKSDNIPSISDSTQHVSEITAEKAENIALSHASLNASDVTFLRTELDFDDGLRVYDVEFYSGNKEYDYEIDAQSGKILSFDYDAEAYAPTAPVKAPEVDPTKPDSTPSISDNTAPKWDNTPTKSEITAEDAENIALSHASLGASDVKFLRTELDFDDGLKVYDVEFYAGNKEYDYEIDAQSGKILSFDYDAEAYAPSAPEKKPQVTPQNPQVTPSTPDKNTQYIGVDKAKSIALSHAGLSLSEVTFKKAKFEDDDGYKEYEIEFYKGRMEYEYTIDALTGTIIEYESEYDD